MSTYEYGFKVWGGYFQTETAQLAGHQEGTYLFSDRRLRNLKLNELLLASARCHDDNAVCISEEFEGEEARYQTIACMIFWVDDVAYPLEYNFGYGRCEHSYYMFAEGNYSCDCNRSMFLRQLYGEIPGLPPDDECGGKIDMKDFHVRLEYGPDGDWLPSSESSVRKPKEST